MRITVITNNGRRVKLAPKAAHKYLWPGWAEIAPEDAEGAKLYLAYLKELGLDPKDRKTPDSHLPEGYSIHRRGQWLTVFGPDETQIGNTVSNMSRALGLAHEHANSTPATVEDVAKPELPEGYEILQTRGWYTVVDRDGYQVGKSVRSEEEAIGVAREDAEAAEE